MRSALQQLVSAGMLTRISGQGSRVRELTDWHLLDPRVSDWMARFAQPNPRIQCDIFAFRVAVEPFMAIQLLVLAALLIWPQLAIWPL